MANNYDDDDDDRPAYIASHSRHQDSSVVRCLPIVSMVSGSSPPSAILPI